MKENLSQCSPDNRLYKNEGWLQKYYIEENMTQREIGKACNVHEKTIYRWTKRLDLKKESWSQNPGKEKLIQLYIKEDKTRPELAERFDVSEPTVNDWLTQHSIKKHDIKKRGKQEQQKTQKEYEEDLTQTHNGKIEVLGNYQGACKKILHICKKCGHRWKARPQAILGGNRCPECSKKEVANRQKKPHRQYLQQVKEIHGEDINILEKYKGVNKKIWHKCNLCNYKWKTTPSSILGNHGCPNCSSSRGERRIKRILENLDLNFEKEIKFENCKGKKNKLPFDFGVKENQEVQALIEFDGEQHAQEIDFFRNDRSSLEKIQERDKIKNKFAEKKGIPLLRVNYHDRKEDKIRDKLYSFLELHNIAIRETRQLL